MSFDFATYATPSSTAAQALKAEADSKTGGLKALATDRSDLFRLNPYNITVKDGWNSRDMRDPDNQAHVDELARSIAAIGVQEPLTVYMDGGKPVLTDGHCRLLAALRAIETYGAEIRSIPVKTEPRGSDEKDRLLSQIIRNGGKRLSPLEQGGVYKRLLNLGWTEAEIARRTGAQQIQVSRYIDLQAAPEPVLDLVATGQVSATLAIETIQKRGDEQAAEILTAAAETAKARGKKKATASTVAEVTTGAKPERKKREKGVPPPSLPLYEEMKAVLDELLLHLPEYDEEANPAFGRAHRRAIHTVALVEGD
jgi:ParB-like chromosome segregation protein Spo0J